MPSSGSWGLAQGRWASPTGRPWSASGSTPPHPLDKGVRHDRCHPDREDHHHPHPPRPSPAHLGPGPGPRHRDDRGPGRDPPPDRLPAGRVHPLRPPDRRPDDRVLRQPPRRRGPVLPGLAPRAARRRPVAPVQGVLQGQQAEDRPGARGQGRGPDGVPVQSRPVRGRAHLRPGGHHPRRPAGPDRPGRHPPRPGPPPGRAAVRRARPGGRVHHPARRVRRGGGGPHPAAARRRPDDPGRPGGRPPRAARLPLVRAEPGSHLPGRVRPPGHRGAVAMTTTDIQRRPVAGPAAPVPVHRRLVGLANDIGPAAQGLAGKPVNVGTLGGYVQWKYGSVLLLIAAFWSVLSLSGTLAGEARRGSLDLVAAAPLSRRRIAFQKVAAHVALLTVVAVVTALAAWLGGSAFAKLPGDEIPLRDAVGFALWVWLMALAFGGLAFALAQFLGRAAAAWIAGFLLVAGPILNNYKTLVPAFAGVARVTPWAWTANHLPLAGQVDWASLVPVAVVAAVLIPLGIEAFARRDLGASAAVRVPGLPALAVGLRGPLGRSFGERLPMALAWGLGLGAFGLAMAAASRSLADAFATSPDLARTVRSVFPGFDLTSAGGFLQLLVQLLFVVAGFAAVTLVSGWATDETSGRLELVLAAPLSRRAWVLRSGLGVFAAIALLTAIVALGVGAGAALAGSDALTPMAGTLALGLYAAALAGVGLAVGGLAGTGVAAATVAVVVVATYLIDLLAPALDLPGWVHQLALTAHLGQPMVGTWDAAGVVACLVLAVGGLLLGAVGLAGRDVRG